jgi:transposase-like protein
MVAPQTREGWLSEQRKYRQFTPEQKAEIVLAGLRGDRSVRDVCREGAVALRPGGTRWSCDHPPGSDGQRQLAERGRHPPVRRLFSGQLVVSASNVLDKRMAGDDHPGTAIPFEAAHRS